MESADLATPPSTPAAGQCWIVASSATGDWAGKDGSLAGWTSGGWRFVLPGIGWPAWVADRGQSMRFDGTVWADENVRSDGYFVAGDRVLAARQSAIADPSGGSTMDNEARAAIAAVLAALRAHGLIAT